MKKFPYVFRKSQADARNNGVFGYRNGTGQGDGCQHLSFEPSLQAQKLLSIATLIS
jgi:hypothetical protein